MGRPSIALAMIVKNEERNLEALLNSVEGCFDEIHITDTGSTDRTVEIAERFGCRVHHFEWCDDFSKARNASFEPVQTDYIMWLDGDDVLSDREKFILWRNHCMDLADYWLAPYHYAVDEKGHPLCAFVRERVFKRTMGFRWKYPIHEGIMPVSPMGNIKPQVTNAWHVVHKRTEEDLKVDRSRNLSILKHMEAEGRLDARMTYYYGKELFEAGQVLDSIFHLGKALGHNTLEIHDRILAMQYLSYAYLQTDKLDQCVQMCQQGILLNPNRAEFWVILGDSFIKMNRLVDAIPFYEAAAKCQFNVESQAMDVIFKTEVAYRAYPRNQLARVYHNLGQFDLALQKAEEAGDEESRKIKVEIERVKKLSVAYKDATPCDDIVITTPMFTAYPFDADTMKEKALGGSETALVEMAYWLKKKSLRRVIVFNMREEEKMCDGVEYRPIKDAAHYFAEHKPYVHIAWRHNMKVTDAPTFVWNHDLQTAGLQFAENYKRAFALTPFHADYMHITQGVPHDKIFITRNGLNPEKFKDLPTEEKDPWRFVFGSSPDRGLDRAMLVLDRVREKYPKITLHVHYGIEHLDKYGLEGLRKHLEKMMEDRKDWVVYHGATPQRQLMESYAKSAYCIQPSDWIETSCITAMEFIACGVYPIFRKVGGVSDTLKNAVADGMASLVDSDCITHAQFDRYANEVKSAIEQNAYMRVKVDAKMYSWEHIADEWLKSFPELIHGIPG